jgi:hypothetical protein
MPTREQKLDAVYRHMHPDYTGRIDGERTVMTYRNGTCLVALDDLTDAEIESKLPKEMRT